MNINLLKTELKAWQHSHRKVLEELAAYRGEDFPGRVKTNGILEKEQYEHRCRARIDSLQRQIRTLESNKKTQAS